MLLVERMDSRRHLHRQVHDLCHGPRCRPEQRKKGFTRYALGHDVGHHREIALTHHARHMRTGQARHDHLLDLEAHDGRPVIAVKDRRDLHHQWRAVKRMRRFPDRRKAAGVQAFAQRETVDHQSGMRSGPHSLSASLQQS